MASDEVRVRGARVGRVTVGQPRASRITPGKVSVELGFKPDPFGMILLAAILDGEAHGSGR